MVRFNMYYYRIVCFILCLFLGNAEPLSGQVNCLVFPEDSGERVACELSYRAIEYRQGSRASQLLFDHAIKIGPKFAWAYYEKSVPFFKRGLFADGVKLINKAIELEPQNYLYYRAYWYFYNRSYELCIRDLEELYTRHNSSYCSTPGGELEMRLLLGMAYAHTGDVAKGISWISKLMDFYNEKPHLKGFYDHFCFGVLYYNNGQMDLAVSEFEKQLEVDGNFADTYYFLGLIKKKQSDDPNAKEYFEEALSRMNRENGGYSMNIFTEYNTSKEDVEKMLED